MRTEDGSQTHLHRSTSSVCLREVCAQWNLPEISSRGPARGMGRVDTRTFVGQWTYVHAAVATRRTDASSGLAPLDRLLLTREPTCSKVWVSRAPASHSHRSSYPLGNSYLWSLLLVLGSFRMPRFQSGCEVCWPDANPLPPGRESHVCGLGPLTHQTESRP
jgi:hypothetical protein